jgi:hypothetical protein
MKVAVHEAGHVIAALALGHRIREVTLDCAHLLHPRSAAGQYVAAIIAAAGPAAAARPHDARLVMLLQPARSRWPTTLRRSASAQGCLKWHRYQSGCQSGGR